MHFSVATYIISIFKTEIIKAKYLTYTLTMEAVGSSETLVPTCQTARHHNQEDS
jgi:hypothetical protein